MGSYDLVIDGGTTNLRVALLNEEGIVMAASKKEAGVSHTAIDGHNGRLKEAVGDAIKELMAEYHLCPADIARCVAYGMITSREGLVEIPHLTAPADAPALRRGMVRKSFPEIAPFPIAFIPGVKNNVDAALLDSFASMDMMRGEETEAVGLWSLLRPTGPGVFVLPGSHNKLIKMGEDGQILGCRTVMSGELLSALTRHTLLAGSVGQSFATLETYDREMALRGYHEAEASGLGRAAFAGRILSTLYQQPPDKVASYLLGAVTQTDAAALKAFTGTDAPIYIAGREPVKTALCDIFQAAGFSAVHPVAEEISSRMGLAGALRIAEVDF